MTIITRAWLCSIVGIVIAGGALTPRLAAAAQESVSAAKSAMSAARQNELVQKRCVMCHNEEQRKGGLSFAAFDAAHPDPGIAHMMVIKVREDGAMSAAGNPVPGREEVQAFLDALSSAIPRTPPVSRGWTVDLAVDPSTPNRGHSFVTARSTLELPLPADARTSAVYELTVSCNGAIRRAGARVATYTKAGSAGELMPRPVPVAPTLAWPVSADVLPVNGLFPGERATFPLNALSPTLRELFSWCFTAPPGEETR